VRGGGIWRFGLYKRRQSPKGDGGLKGGMRKKGRWGG